MSNQRQTFHIHTTKDGWALRKDGKQKPVLRAASKELLYSYAFEILVNRPDVTVYLHNEFGRVEAVIKKDG